MAENAPARRIAALIFPQFEALDMFGPVEMFGLLPEAFEILMVAEDRTAVRCKQGPASQVDLTFDDPVNYDLVLIPGGSGARTAVDNAALMDWVRRACAHAEIVMSVCTGSAILAKAGVLDGKRATTNKAAFDWVRSQSARVDWVPQARWVEDGNVFTSAGVSAGMDMSLAVVARLYGLETARQIAIWAEYDWHEKADWDPFAKIHGLV